MTEQPIPDPNLQTIAFAMTTLTPLERAQQNARTVLDKYIGSIPKPADRKILELKQRDYLQGDLSRYVSQGNLDVVQSLLHQLQEANQLDPEEALTLLSQTAGMRMAEEAGNLSSKIRLLRFTKQISAQHVFDIVAEKVSAIREMRDVVAEIASAQLKLTIACHQVP